MRLLVFLVLLQIADSCLKVHYPSCQCPFGSLDSSNLKSLIGTSPFYSNISSYPISAPTTVTDSGNCSITVSCPIGYSLLVFDTTDYTLFGDVELNGFCQKSDQTWLVDGGDYYDYGGNSYDQLLSVCVDYSSSSEGCGCPAIGSITQGDISSLAYGSYLSGRSTSAVNVDVDEDCKITVDVSNINYSDFYFMIFSDDAPPIFNRRFLNTSSKTSTFSPTGIQCNSATAQWENYNGPITNIKFAAQDNSGQCSCGSFPDSTRPLPGVCDIVEMSCSGLSMIYTYMQTFNMLTPTGGDQIIYDFTCVGGTWYYNGISLDEVQAWCNEVPGEVIYGMPYNYTYHCGCRDLMPITISNEYLQIYDTYPPTYGDGNYSINTPSIVYPTDCTSAPQISCPDSEELVVFSKNYKPMSYSPSSPPSMSCQPSPLVQSAVSLAAGSMWIVDGVRLMEPAIGCFGKPKCACPAIGSITQTDIGKLDYGSYLSGRSTSAVDVTVEDQCEITVDVSNIDYSDFYFMIFSDEAQPIFNRRFLSTSSKTSTFSPTGIQCNSATGQWENYNGPITNMTFAAQDNSEQCSCGSFPNATTPIAGVCDIVEMSCSGLFMMSTPTQMWKLLTPKESDQTIYDLTCVSGTWYYNGVGLDEVQAWCNPVPVEVIYGEQRDYTYHCGCRDLLPFYPDLSLVYDNWPNMTYGGGGYHIITPTITYPTDCTAQPQISCDDDATILVVFSRNYKQMVYTPQTPPQMTCQPSPLIQSSVSMASANMWIVDGVLLSEPTIGCFLNCACDNIGSITQAEIGQLAYGSYLAGRPTRDVGVTVGAYCGVFIDVAELWDWPDFYVMIYRDNGQPIFSRHFAPAEGGDYEVEGLTCNTNTAQWEYFGDPIINPRITAQQEECGCLAPTDINYINGVTVTSVTPEQTCTRWQTACSEPMILMTTEYNAVYMPPYSVLTDLTCVNATWWYNSQHLGVHVGWACMEKWSLLDVEVYQARCGTCGPIIPYFNYAKGNVSYSADECTAQLSCSDSSQTLNVLNSDYEKIFEGTQAELICRQSPMGTAFSNSTKFWYLGGNMINTPYFGCVSN